MKFKPFKQDLREKNLVRYKGIPPSVDMVKKTIEQSKLSRRSFEITYGIVGKTLERYMSGARELPTVYWHIFYEFNSLEKFYTNFMKTQTKKVKEKVKKEIKEIIIPQSNKSIIDAYRARVN